MELPLHVTSADVSDGRRDLLNASAGAAVVVTASMEVGGQEA